MPALLKKDKERKIQELRKKLSFYREKLAKELIGYKGVRHESAASEIKHDKVMVLRAMLEALEEEIKKLEEEM